MQLLSTTWSFSRNLGAPLLSGLSELRHSSILDKTGVIYRTDSIISKHSLKIGRIVLLLPTALLELGKVYRATYSHIRGWIKSYAHFLKISPILLLHSVAALVSQTSLVWKLHTMEIWTDSYIFLYISSFHVPRLFKSLFPLHIYFIFLSLLWELSYTLFV